jgi:SAM-dependent methyltransferase
MGVHKVPEERWKQAQAWELDVWKMHQSLEDDWNKWWAVKFDGYGFLPSNLGKVIELGCGPFTNVRIILIGRTAKLVVCSDPLALQYTAMPLTWLSKAQAEGQVQVDDNPIEKCPFAPRTYDLVVMINVLDHVQNLKKCMRTAVGLVRRGGIFLLGQDLSNEEDIEKTKDDVGHPIKVAQEDLEHYVRHLEPLVKKTLPRNEGRNPDAHYGTLIYAGKRI